MAEPEQSSGLPDTPGTLRAGAATVDITPGDLRRTFLAGFDVGRRAQAVLEPLSASCVYLEAGGDSAAFLSLDLIGLPRPWMEKIRSRATRLADPRKILCHATHTHSGPDTLGLWGPALFSGLPRASGVNPGYMEELVEKAADCVDRAARDARPARLRAASFEVPARFTRNDRKGGARYDHAVALVLDDDRGERVASVLNHACHPETLWRANTALSPDFPGAFRRRVQQLAGGVALYLSGPLGAMLTPDVPESASTEVRRSFAEVMGSYLAERSEREVSAATSDPSPRLEHGVHSFRLANDNWRFRLLQRLGWLASSGKGGGIDTDVHHLRFGDVECLSAPGELAPEVGERVRELMQLPHRMVVGLCDDEVGYILEPRMFEDREYRYETSMSLGRRTADDLIDACRALVGA